MKRYLLFDSGCSLCSKLAEAIEQEAGGKLMVRSLRDPAVKELLDREQPGWKWAPMLMEEKEDKARIYAGWAMSRRLLVVLGPRRAWKIMEVLTEARIPESVSPQDTGRRNFLSVMGATAVSAIALMIPGVSRADEGSTHRTFLPMVGAENDNNSTAPFLEYDLPSPEVQKAFRQKAYDSGKFEQFLEKTLSEYDHLSPDEDDSIPRVFIVNDTENSGKV